MTYRVVLAPAAAETLGSLLNRQLRAALERRIGALRRNPAEQGMALTSSLRGLYALRTEGGWCRIIYQIASGQVEILALHMGVGSATPAERDWLGLARRLFRQRLL